MVAGPDGSVVVSGGFHVPRIFQISAAGAVSVLADELSDPEGIALDAQGRLYVAESSVHRIIRLRALQHGGG
jgi:sugar lactone lactonase YvrE